MKNYNWNAAAFFEALTNKNKLAIANNFKFCIASGQQGFEEILDQMQTETAFVCVNDGTDGYTSVEGNPSTRRVKTIFLAKRHAFNDMQARETAMGILRELFRQFMTVLISQRTKLDEYFIHVDPRITFKEIDSYFAAGCACAVFQVAVDLPTDLQYNDNEWETDVFTNMFNFVFQ